MLAIVTVSAIAMLFGALFVYGQISELQNRIGDLKANNSALEVQISDIQTELNETQSKLNETQSQLREQHDNLKDITYELALKRQLVVLVTNFTWVGDFNPMVGLTISYSVIVHVRNNDSLGENKLS